MDAYGDNVVRCQFVPSVCIRTLGRGSEKSPSPVRFYLDEADAQGVKAIISATFAGMGVRPLRGARGEGALGIGGPSDLILRPKDWFVH